LTRYVRIRLITLRFGKRDTDWKLDWKLFMRKRKFIGNREVEKIGYYKVMQIPKFSHLCKWKKVEN
jgi:hypothetical protein